ncbi:hypothetical protein MOQ_007408, partial [Trypanosoma cruzi marinkellei]
MTGALRCGEDSVPGVRSDIVPRFAALRKARCGSCPLFDRPARALQITSDPLCRWRRSFLTEEAGTPPPLPCPLPDVNTASPCRPANGGLASSCPICGRVHSSIHNTRAHARHARPGVPIVDEGVTCGCRDGTTFFVTSVLRAGQYRRGKHAGRKHTQEAQTRVHRMDQALPPPLQHRCDVPIPRRTTVHVASSTAVMPCRWVLGLRRCGAAPACTTARTETECRPPLLRTSLAL